MEWEEGTHSIVCAKDVDGVASSLKKGDVTEWYAATILGSGTLYVYVYVCLYMQCEEPLLFMLLANAPYNWMFMQGVILFVL